MPASITIDPARSAVLTTDYHTSIVAIYARDDQPALLARTSSVLKTAREAGMTVIHVRVGFPKSAPATLCSVRLNRRSSIRNCLRARQARFIRWSPPKGTTSL